jgi:hypothetical protein
MRYRGEMIKNLGSSDVFAAVRLRKPVFRNVTLHSWVDVSQSFDKPAAFILKVKVSFLTLEDEDTTFIRNVGNQRCSVTFQTTGILDENHNKVKHLMSFIKHYIIRTNAKLVAVYNSTNL